MEALVQDAWPTYNIVFAGLESLLFAHSSRNLSVSVKTHASSLESHEEGWKTVSAKKRNFDLTNGVVLPAVLLGLLIMGGFRIWQLAKKRSSMDGFLVRGKRSMSMLYGKLGIASTLVLIAAIRLVFAIVLSPQPTWDERTYLAVLKVVSFLMTVTPLTYFNHLYTRRSSTILLTFYPTLILVSAYTIWTSFTSLTPKHRLLTADFALSIVEVGLVFVIWLMECIGPELDEMVDGFVNIEKSVKESPYETANIYSRLAFSWLTPLMQLGSKRFIVQEDLYEQAPDDQSSTVGRKLQQNWDKARLTKENPSLWLILAKSYGGPYVIAALLKVFTDLLQFVQPQLLRLLLAFISRYQADPNGTSTVEGFALSGLMFLAAIAQSAILHQYFNLCFLTGSRVRAGLVMVIYQKALVLSNDDTTVRGDVVNLMSVDASRLQDLCTYGLIAISGPFQVALAFISLYKLLGWPSFVGVGVMTLAVPINTWLAKYLKKLQVEQMKNRDGRTRMMSELLNNIKSIKLYAWESTFAKRILDLRNQRELKMLKKIGVMTAISTVFWSMVPLFVAFSSFATAAYAGSVPLTADIIFPAISLFMLLQFPLGMFSMITTSIITAMVSVSRISAFLNAEELQKDARTTPPPIPEVSGAADVTNLKPVIPQGQTVLKINGGEFRWSSKTVESVLEDVDLEVKMGDLVGVFGRVGAGKSSLLSAMAGEMTRTEGAVEVFGTVAYAPQNPWIMSTTVRENITFFRHFDKEFYEAVLDACALRHDLELLPHGDMTEVGEKGITLSGGQRARISLARCVYARADLYLLDDVLAAVDAHVSRHLFNRVIGPRGLLAGKARILVTNSVSSVREYDNILLLRRGIILERGSYDEIMSKPDSELCKLITEFSSSSSSSSPNSGTATPTSESHGSTLAGSDGSGSPSSEPEPSANLDTLGGKLGALLSKRPLLLSREEQQVEYEESLRHKSTMFLKEASEQGKVKWAVYMEYLEHASRWGVAIFLISIFAQQAFTILSNLALRSWGENNRAEGETEDAGPYLLRYGLCIVAASISSLSAGIILWVFCAVRSARRLHDAMLKAVLRAPLGWFERTPQGRLLNLFSKDTNVIDETLVRVFSSFFRTMANVAGILIVMGASLPMSLIAVVPLAIIYQRFMSYYLATSRELKRLDAVSRSPIFAWFSESLGGLSTIRAFQVQPLFTHINEMRSDTNLQAYLPSTYVNRWLAVRLEFIGACIVLIAAVLSISTLVISGKIDSGLVGLVLSYALSTTGSLNWVIRSASDVEQNIVSVERVISYINVEPEAPADILETKPDSEWPRDGAIQLDHFSMRYRPELDLVLRDISVDIKPGERVGIVGRTGAGKSSLILGLLRINEAASGSILIDGVDISKIGLHDLRSVISIIPQEPQLFEGTIRQNVDVTETSSDEAIWHALDQVHLKAYVSQIGGLDAKVREGGSSLSSGQRQLICFARALIRHSRILILDEATSAVDLESDQAIQEILRGDQFNGVTMLVIAHRIHTIIGSDRILVLESGKVAEFDTPDGLLANPASIFASLAAEASTA